MKSKVAGVAAEWTAPRAVRTRAGRSISAVRSSRLSRAVVPSDTAVSISPYARLLSDVRSSRLDRACRIRRSGPAVRGSSRRTSRRRSRPGRRRTRTRGSPRPPRRRTSGRDDVGVVVYLHRAADAGRPAVGVVLAARGTQMRDNGYRMASITIRSSDRSRAEAASNRPNSAGRSVSRAGNPDRQASRATRRPHSNCEQARQTTSRPPSIATAPRPMQTAQKETRSTTFRRASMVA